MDNDLIDHHRGEEGCAKGEQLDHEGGNQDIAPDTAVPEEFGNEPEEAEFAAGRLDRVGIAGSTRFERQLKGDTGEAFGKHFGRPGDGPIGAGFEQHDPRRCGLNDERGA
ncbi:MAG: hypothetical protein ACYDHY_12980 [Acidiferrobacterales bacterium]